MMILLPVTYSNNQSDHAAVWVNILGTPLLLIAALSTNIYPRMHRSVAVFWSSRNS